MVVYPIFLVRGKNQGSDAICALLQSQKSLQKYVKPVFLDDINAARRAQLKGVPALKNDNGILYGSEAIDFLKKLGMQSQGPQEASTDGNDFIFLHQDDTVSFDPSKIRSEQDFVIPSNPIGNNDVDTSFAREQAMRDAMDAEMKMNSRQRT